MPLKIRHNQCHLEALHAKKRGRILIITGARQTGKSTLARAVFPQHQHINLDDPQERAVYARLTPEAWIQHYPEAVIDEAQKLPQIFDTIKACYDRAPHVRYVMLGSSQVLLMKEVRETLAGRAALTELFAFTMPEMVAQPGAAPSRSLLEKLVHADAPAEIMAAVSPAYAVSSEHARQAQAWESFLRTGAMPAVAADEWSIEDQNEWLQDYQRTYLQRDLGDLARLDRLEPFVRAQQAAALRTAQTVNFSELARLSDVTAPTAKNFMNYLSLSYQVVLLPAWFANLEKRLTKQPKLHFLDPGVRRAIIRRQGQPDGAEFESGVVAEVVKQSRTGRWPITLHHLRTADGREIDLLLEREDGFIALECKKSQRVGGADFRHLRGAEELLNKPLLLGLVVSQDTELHQPEPWLYGIHAAALLA